jgi:hypothetical protein
MLATEVAEGVAPELGAAISLNVRVETHVDLHPGTSTEVVVHEPEVQEATPIRSAPISETTSTSCVCLELLAGDLIDPTVVARNMESMRCVEQWIKIRCGYPE